MPFAIIALFSFFLAIIGIAGVVSPPMLVAWVSRLQNRRGLLAIAALRIVLGAALVAAASGSRAPGFLRVVGMVAIVTGLLTPFLGLQRFERLLGWWSRQPNVLVRVWCLGVVALGASLVWATYR